MLILKIMLILLGFSFITFGYLIYSKKRYDLINGFESDLKVGRKTEEYAKKVGKIELAIGAVLLIAGIVVIINF